MLKISIFTTSFALQIFAGIVSVTISLSSAEDNSMCELFGKTQCVA
jgi:hypothetical protein